MSHVETPGKSHFAGALVVDDEGGLTLLVRAILEDSDYLVDVAKDGVEACERVKERRYDAIICDIVMPNMDGIQFYTELSKIDATQAERLMFVTGMDMDEETRRQIRDTGRPVLHKPFEIGKFTAAVRRLVRGEE